MKTIITKITLSLGLVAATVSATPILLVSTQGNGSNGSLTNLNCPTGPCGSAIGNIDAATGLLATFVNITGMSQPDEEIFDIAVNTAGEVYGVTNMNLYRINPNTGVATLIGSGYGGTGMNGLAFLGAVLYGTRNNTTQLYTIDTGTGLASSVGSWEGTHVDLPSGTHSGGDIEFVGSSLYLASDNDRIIQINPNTGVATRVGPANLGATGADLFKGLGSDGTNLYLAVDCRTGAGGCTGNAGLIQIELGAVNFGTALTNQLWNGTGVAPTGVGLPGGMTGSVPEPSVFFLSSIGFGLIGLSRYKRKSKA